jgi:hypothetical protein
MRFVPSVLMMVCAVTAVAAADELTIQERNSLMTACSFAQAQGPAELRRCQSKELAELGIP